MGRHRHYIHICVSVLYDMGCRLQSIRLRDPSRAEPRDSHESRAGGEQHYELWSCVHHAYSTIQVEFRGLFPLCWGEHAYPSGVWVVYAGDEGEEFRGYWGGV